MGVETAIAIGLGVAGGMAATKALTGSATGKAEAPALESGTQKSIEAGLSDSDARRRQVMSQLSRLQKQTLLAKKDQSQVQVKKTVLGPGL